MTTPGSNYTCLMANAPYCDLGASERRLGPRAAGDSAGQPRAGRAGRRQGLGAGGATTRRGAGVRATARRGPERGIQIERRGFRDSVALFS